MLIAGLVAVLTMYMIGYRFDAQDRTITQGGLLQLDSVPGAATVTVDGSTLGARTATRLDATAGSHTVTMSRDGYHPWQKTATVEPGEILWLNYARLVPKTITPQTMYEYASLSGAISNIKNEKIALLPDAALPRIDVVVADNGSAPRKTIELPASSFTAAAEGQAHHFTLEKWDREGRYLLMKHTIGDTTEWLNIDTTAVDQSHNISTIVGRPVDSAMYDETDPRRIYVLSDTSLRLVDMGQSTVSAPIAQHVTNMRQSTKGVVTYVTTDQANNKRTVEYYTPRASRSQVIQTASIDGSTLDGQIIEYAQEQYSAVIANSILTINKLSLHPSDSSSTLSPTMIAQIALPDGADSISFSPNGRFVVAQKYTSLVVYDLELNHRYSFMLRSQSLVNSLSVRWFDDYHLYTDTDSELRWYEFDGDNSRALTTVAPGYDTVLSPSGKYVYAVQPSATGKQLVRIKLAD